MLPKGYRGSYGIDEGDPGTPLHNPTGGRELRKILHDYFVIEAQCTPTFAKTEKNNTI